MNIIGFSFRDRTICSILDDVLRLKPLRDRPKAFLINRQTPVNALFARTMEILTWAGLALMAIPGMAYLIEEQGYVGVRSASNNWGKPAAMFWEATRGIKINGYLWFLDHLTNMDCLSLVGITVLAAVPLLSIIVAMTKMNTKYRVIIAIIVAEFIIAIMRPFL